MAMKKHRLCGAVTDEDLGLCTLSSIITLGIEAKLPTDRSLWRTENGRVGVAGRLALEACQGDFGSRISGSLASSELHRV